MISSRRECRLDTAKYLNIPALRAKGLHRELLEHKGELRPSWYREAVEQELNDENQSPWWVKMGEGGLWWVMVGDGG